MTFKGKGTIHLPNPTQDLTQIHGNLTEFLKEIEPRSIISIPAVPDVTMEVAEVISNTELRLLKPVTAEMALKMLSGLDGVAFKVVPHVDQVGLFDKVAEVLEKDGAVGIFPEGGSHDRPHLLPLKAGVAVMALSTMAANANVNIKIVPVGLNYFHPHRFRSRAVIEFGAPIEIKQDLLEMYRSGGPLKREAVSRLIEDVKSSLKAVTVEFPDFETMMVVTAARRLYRPKGIKLKPSQVCELLRFKDEPKVKELSSRLVEYNDRLKDFGIRDHQVEGTRDGRLAALALMMVRMLQVSFFALLALPGFVINAPVMLLCELISRSKARGQFTSFTFRTHATTFAKHLTSSTQKKPQAALSASTVKIHGHDVIATWKILVASLLIPLTHLLLALLAVIFIPLPFPLLISLFFVILFLGPAISYAGVRASEVGMDVARSLKSLAMAIVRPDEEREALRRLRGELREEVGNVVAVYGGLVGVVVEGNGGGEESKGGLPGTAPENGRGLLWNGSRWFEGVGGDGGEENDEFGGEDEVGEVGRVRVYVDGCGSGDEVVEAAARAAHV
ncbi:hypothetical protein HDU67_003576 [Dinochytrium kinnereticum]|nr:hypothetical protein HDU67_003576 [Dinochytrium kinnereticum]